MKYISTIIGGAIVGALVYGIWPEMWKSYGIFGGWTASFILVGLAWFMNHWLGIIDNPKGRVWVDQGWPIASAGAVWAMVRFGAPFSDSIGTLLLVVLGGILGGLAAFAVKRSNPAFHEPVEEVMQEEELTEA